MLALLCMACNGGRCFPSYFWAIRIKHSAETTLKSITAVLMTLGSVMVLVGAQSRDWMDHLWRHLYGFEFKKWKPISVHLNNAPTMDDEDKS